MTAFALPQDWRAALKGALATKDTLVLQGFLDAELAAGKTIYPPQDTWFRALELTPLDQVRVVILGQDPYHGPGQAHGLCFSVPPGVRPPPSLANIYKELESDLALPRPHHGFLEHWARQGVLLLNSVLTVEMAKAASHSKKGWEQFTDAIVAAVNDKAEPVVFMLWGAYAHKKAANVDASRHLVLKAAHPSPLSAHNGFLGTKHFSQCNDFLVSNGNPPIDWTLPDGVR
ncbi:MAG: uracil-DNA glycosylase [Pseudomonadota bacterium]